MQEMLHLALPRLHPALALAGQGVDIFPGVHILWPGLPNPPGRAWVPTFFWSAEEAEACLSDFAFTAALGASAAPVVNYSLDTFYASQAGLSQAEKTALLEFRDGSSPGSGPAQQAPSREADGKLAQRILLLAWFQESQTMELRKIEAAVQEKQRALSSSLGETGGLATQGMPVPFSGESTMPLPDWEMVLAAAWEFFPQARQDGKTLRIVVNDVPMAEALATRGRPEQDMTGVPPGWSAVKLGRGKALGIQGRGDDLEEIFLFPSPD